MRLIDADKLIIPSEEIVARMTIDNAPTVEERPKGKWESVGFAGMKYACCRCSICHKTTKIYLDRDNDFCCIADIRNKAVACLFCGADMKEADNEQ